MKIAKKAGAMGIAVTLSRFLGLLREQVFAFIFGAGFHSDSLLVAFRIPNLLRDLLAEGALSSSFVSVFSKEKNAEDKQALYKKVMRLLFLLLFIVTLFLFFTAPWIVELMAGAFKQVEGKFELTVSLTKILTPFLALSSLAAISMGLLNSLGYYFLPALGAAAFNLCSITVGGFGAYYLIIQGASLTQASVLFAWATLLGGLASWLVQWKKMLDNGYRPLTGLKVFWKFRDSLAALKDKRVLRILSMLGPAVVTVGALQVNVFVNTGIAASLEQGSVTWLNYAYRLLHFPMGVLGVSLFMAALPSLSLYAREDKNLFHSTLKEAMGLTIFVSIGAAAGLVLFAKPIIAILFEHGNFTAADVLQSSVALQAYALGLLAFNMNKILGSAFFALESVWTPAFLALLTIFANYTFATYFSQSLGHSGIALSVSVTSLLNTVLLFVFLKRKSVQLPTRWLLKIIGVSFVAQIPLYLLLRWGLDEKLWALKYQNLPLAFGALLLCIVLAGAMYLGLSAMLIPEARLYARRLRRRK